MKKLIISKALKNAVMPEIIKEIYRIVSSLPSTGVEHHFYVSNNEAETLLIHNIPSIEFHYTLIIQNGIKVNEETHIIAIDVGDKILMSLSSEIIR